MSMEKETSKSLKTCIFDRIEAEGVTPRSRLFFHSYECGVWFLWLVSVVIGSLAVAVTWFVATYRRYALYEVTHDSFVSFVVHVLPYVWIVTFVAMIVWGLYSLRHTKRGYRYPLWQIVGSSAFLSVLFGVGLHALGVGYVADKAMGDRMPLYQSQEKLEFAFWQNPEAGRLVAKVVHNTIIPTSTMVMVDRDNVRWTVDVSELHAVDHDVLGHGDFIRLLGTTTNQSTKRFHACGAFPWLLADPLPMSELEADRVAAMERIYAHKSSAKARLEALQTEYQETADPRATSKVCADLAVVGRVERSMH
jgi:hypothetical protein